MTICCLLSLPSFFCWLGMSIYTFITPVNGQTELPDVLESTDLRRIMSAAGELRRALQAAGILSPKCRFVIFLQDKKATPLCLAP